jgi:8-oxo-dGTP pyrophosphatase MutT (NUDIX family)
MILRAQVKSKKATKIARRGEMLDQVGALPYRRDPSGKIEFLLVTSRGTRRFVIPKGWRMKGKSDSQAAALEARQEAGVRGRINPAAIGSYQYWKRLGRAFVPVNVAVYALEVETESPKWREAGQREKQWLTAEQAAMLVDEPELVSLIAGFTPSG